MIKELILIIKRLRTIEVCSHVINIKINNTYMYKNEC